MNRRIEITASYALPGELVVDSFAGGGGASTGIEAALGRPVDIAVNHSAEAIAIHKANHPETKHFCQDIWEVDPREACGSRPVGLAWFSPDCKHFSKAKGTKPLDKKIRGLAWVVIRWAKAVKPRVIVLENVEEFQDWGPLDENDRPIPERAGETFRQWLGKLKAQGYEVEFKELVAADYGTPTTRKRLFMIARRDGQRAVWPSPTHGDGRGQAWRPAADVIDWSLPVRSIFDPTRPKPLAEATLKRIATGIRRFVVEAADPFMIPVTHAGDSRVYSVREPMRTVTGSHRGDFAVVEPFVVRHGHYSTKTGAGLVEGAQGVGTFRGQPLDRPLSTVCATNDKHLVCPIITKHYGRQVGHGMKKTLGTVTARDHHALTAAFLTKFYGTCTSGQSVRLPLPTVTANGRGGGHLAEVRAFLVKYYGQSTASSLRRPLGALTTRDRFGLVTIHGEDYEIIDIGMRMLAPHELFAAQGFPADYEIAPSFNGRPLTKTAQISAAGNSVCPQVAEAVIAANVRGAA
jgi:DNA (cytosine-5)-methyltransferase 1